MSGIRLNAPVALAQFPGVRSILAGQQVGTFPINENADFGVVDDYEAALGGVSVNLKGQLTVRPNGTYDFDGDYGIEPDRYDFDPKPRGTRDLPAEAVVRFIDQFVSGTPFMNHVVGRRPLRERGGR